MREVKRLSSKKVHICGEQSSIPAQSELNLIPPSPSMHCERYCPQCAFLSDLICYMFRSSQKLHGLKMCIRDRANLGSTIAMAFDECMENPAEYHYAKNSCERTVRWLVRCKAELVRLKQEGAAVNPQQMLFGINQGCCYDDLRIEHMKQIRELDLDGYAIGGLAVGEPRCV